MQSGSKYSRTLIEPLIFGSARHLGLIYRLAGLSRATVWFGVLLA
jgi:hypothetical protein